MDGIDPPPGGGTPLRGNRSLIVLKENETLKKEINNLNKIIEKLRNDVQALIFENDFLKNQPASSNNGSNRFQILALEDNNVHTEEEEVENFETDEEELERETNWILQKSRKKNKTPSSKPLQAPQKTQSEEQQPPKPKPPPPINIVGINSFPEIKDIIATASVDDYKFTSLNNNVWKINTFSTDDYRSLSKTLNDKNLQWYTFENKNERPHQVMVRGLHPTCPKDDIIAELQDKGFNPVDAVNIMKKERVETDGSVSHSLRSLPLFRISFSREDDINKIYKIYSILNMRVKIEAVKKSSHNIPQCKRCQGFHHTHNYCSREPRCVKCAGKHTIDKCDKSDNITPKCVNCHGEHPASYRGCDVAKELQRIRHKTLLAKRATNANPPIEIDNIQNQVQQENLQQPQQIYQHQQQYQPQHNQQHQYIHQQQFQQMQENLHQPQQSYQIQQQQHHYFNQQHGQPIYQQPRNRSQQQQIRQQRPIQSFAEVIQNNDSNNCNNSNKDNILNEILKNIQNINHRLDKIESKVFNNRL